MKEQERIYFEELTQDRSESADMLEKPSMRGIKNSVVEKYSDQAHFIYELLQNADDAGATKARFYLKKDQLIFAHDGTRHFSVSNPKSEDKDSQTGELGDINAITSIANSNKTEASIGKFGVGFKAVFQYTSTPFIYDQDTWFRIDRFIVPSLLDSDYPDRRQNETLFRFPFDHPNRSSEESYGDIISKINDLSYPLLFLSKLSRIDFNTEATSGWYSKKIIDVQQFGETTAEHICLEKSTGTELSLDELWLFSRNDESGRRYSVGFFIQNNGQLRAVSEPAFCFFPTKEVTNLNFIVHAPFLLTDSREGIRAGVEHNVGMITRLAVLAADSLVFLRDLGKEQTIRLIDDSILDVIPVDPNAFDEENNKRKISFKPFYTTIKRKVKQEELLPTRNGYTNTINAYWAESTKLTELFSDEQLCDICDNENAQWVFTSLGRRGVQVNNRPLFNYIDSLVRTDLSEDVIISGREKEFYYNRLLDKKIPLENIKGITPEFIEKQSIEWLCEFYKWLSETRHRTMLVKDKPIFLDQDGKAAAAFDKKDQPILFQSDEIIPGYRFINSALLADPDVKQFIDQMGVKEPSFRDRIYNLVLPQYKNSGKIDVKAHFVLFFDYYCKCSREEEKELIDILRDCKFLMYNKIGSTDLYRGKANELYFPSENLKNFLSEKPDVNYLALEAYRQLIGSDHKKEKLLMQFFEELGVRKEVRILTVEVDPATCHRADLPIPRTRREIKYEETIIEGCKELVNSITTDNNQEKSRALWDGLLRVIEVYCNNKDCKSLSRLLTGICYYFYRRPQEETFTSSDANMLRRKKWIMSKTGEFVSADEISLSELADMYDTDSRCSEDLIGFLKFKEEDTDDNSNLTETQRIKIEFVNKLSELGIDETNIEDIKEFIRQKRAKENDTKKDNTQSDESQSLKIIDSETSRVVRDIVERTKTRSTAPIESVAEDDDVDQDEWMPPVVDYSKRIENAKQKSASEIEQIARFEDLQNKAINAKRYSYGWFKALLEMECLSNSDSALRSREVSINFANVERESGALRTLVLKHPDRHIPHFMEDLADIPMILHMGEETKTVVIEAANVQSYTLRVKMKKGSEIDGINLDTVTNISINAKSPAFLLEELRKQFDELGYEDNFNMQKNLCKNIKFVFGPPGTGKTTHLAQNVIIPMMRQEEECRVLVLTPTNKAADVLVNRIMEVSGDDTDYNNWLVRFGVTGEESIEQSEVFRDKSFDIRELSRSVTITTIARFPYDYFMPNSERLFLNSIKWDYIIIDEASMIPIANIIYPLYKKTPREFIIAGDPFQIEPITAVDLWRNENIYTLVKLDSFVEPQTIPHPYQVELLTTQYRSIPSVGNIFSKFAYGGILKHFRAEDSQRIIKTDEKLNVGTLNIIKFPVSKYESIYKCKRLQHSSAYQIYSALFTFEYVKHLANSLVLNEKGETVKIGIIAPYRAQADMIDKLFASEQLPKQVDVQVGTIHGFQGDECDIIFAVFNTPPTISSSKEMFLNKRNIINVSISRARDYLFVIMPDDNTENINNLQLVKRVESLIKDSDDWREFNTRNLEYLMFNDSNYLENNSFSTSHQSINVYGLPERKYEVRAEDTAVDVQIHNNADVSSQYTSTQVIPTEKDDNTDHAITDMQRHYLQTIIELSKEKREIGPTELCKTLGQPRSIVLSNLKELRKKGYIIIDNDKGWIVVPASKGEA